MTRSQIIQQMCEETNVPKKDLDEVLLLLFRTLKKNIIKGNTVYFRGFGTFGTKLRRERVARNLKTNEKLIVPEHQVPYFQPGKELKSIKMMTR